MMDGLTLEETIPGPLIMVLGFVRYMGAHHQFKASGIMASLGLLTTVDYTFLPCFLFIFAGLPYIERSQDNPVFKQALSMVAAAVVGIILNLCNYFLVRLFLQEAGSGKIFLFHI
jgi:chromate transporter